MQTYYLAVDIGASSGRHVMGWLEDGKLKTKEIYRFPNELKQKGKSLTWDLFQLFYHIIKGMKECNRLGMIPTSMGIDTWAVDYVLLKKDNQILGNTYAYRDGRTNQMDEKVYQVISEANLYQRTGIQKQPFNTIYQLMAHKEHEPQLLELAETFLMIPDYFHYLLTGVKTVEYTNATTTQLVNPDTKDWDYELMEQLGLPKKIFPKISLPGTNLGELTENIAKSVGFTCNIVLPTTHDTASAVVAVPKSNDHSIYISSGTWSLMGVEREQPNCSEESRKKNFTNEGGYDYRYRYLKNIMGMWMIQSVKKEIGELYSFAEISEMASKETISSIVDCNDASFLAPASMVKAIQKFCARTKQTVPNTLGEIACVIYHSLAKCYAETVKELSNLHQIPYDTIHVIGGGANAEFLNHLTAKESGCIVKAGPTEATAIGNLCVQMIAGGELKNLGDARATISNSFIMKQYEA